MVSSVGIFTDPFVARNSYQLLLLSRANIRQIYVHRRTFRMLINRVMGFDVFFSKYFFTIFMDAHPRPPYTMCFD